MKNTIYYDEEVFDLIEKERIRQTNNIELIASENYVSKEVLMAQGSILTNKYAEGYPQNRYYGGCQYIDQIEMLAIERCKKLFNVKYANVQPHSGSSANLGAYRSLLKPGDKVLGMALDQGGHLTHGHHLNFSGIDYEFYSYNVNRETELIDYDEVRKLALKIKPKLIVCGASSYSQIIDYSQFRKICDEVNAHLMVDMAHVAGLVAASFYPNPSQYADIVTFTTHKTLRGPRGGVIITNDLELSKKIDQVVFPGIQGGPLEHVIAAKAVAFKEAMSDEFVKYQKQVLDNAKAMCDEFIKLGYKIVSNGTSKHMFCVDVKKSLGITGIEAEKILDKVLITVNKNAIPYDEEKPKITSGIRIGTPAITSRGFDTNEAIKIVHLIDKALKNKDNNNVLIDIEKEVKELTKKHPLPL